MFDENPVFSCLIAHTRSNEQIWWTSFHQGLIGETQDGYPVLSLNAQSGQVLRQELTVHIAAPVKRSRGRPAPAAGGRPGAPAGERAGSPAPAAAPESSALFDRLRALRKRLADEHGVPPYVVFHDATLREMVERRPLNLNQFAELPGVGQAKLARYGDHFIAAIGEFSA